MCGIVGTVDFTGRPVADVALNAMAELVRHRGPDSHGQWARAGSGPAAAFGHRRLAVLDLRDCASQPMHNTACVDAGRATPLVLVFNGEIYNYRELRAGLIARGHHLQSDSDSEAILHLFEEQGPDCVRDLRGMFALAIWDEAGRRLFCARDRIGKKPFYYRYHNGRFWFASEVRAILSDPDVPVRVKPAAIETYVRLGYVPGPESAFEGIERLQPGHIAVVDERGVHRRRYWQLAYTPKRQLGEQDAIAELRAKLQEAVRIRLVSDVPLGAFLSGGIDSSAVVAAMCRESATVETFSIGFDDPEYNELPYAREVSSQFGTRHHEFVVTPDAVGVASRLAWHYGEPYADSSAIPTYYLSQLARQHITVALNGDGGDESFGGYTRYAAYRAALKYQRLPGVVRKPAEALATRLRAASAKSSAHRIKRFFKGAALPPHRLYASWSQYFEGHDDLLQAPAHSDPLDRLRSEFTRAGELDPAETAMSADVALYLPDDLLVKVDIATMAHGLEARSPFLDHHVMEFAASLPVEYKVHGHAKKWLLKRALRGHVPDAVLDRPKMGFGVPLDRWFRTGLKEIASDLLGGPDAGRGYFRHGAVQRLLQEHQSGRAAHGQRLWCVLMLEIWFRTYIDVPRPSPTTGAMAAAREHA
jgi:asparagine synthase (glutamine-hydrolysing)